MGHSQSYDLRNPEFEEKNRDPVRGVRRISREHQSETRFNEENQQNEQENFDLQREEELRERIRNEQLKRREEELDTLRIKQKETREPIIDAYRQTTNQPNSFNEFNHYDSLKHSHPIDPITYEKLHRHSEVNNGNQMEFRVAKSEYHAIRQLESPIAAEPITRYEKTQREKPDGPIGYPVSHKYTGSLSPLSRHPEVEKHAMPRYIPPMTHNQQQYDTVPEQHPQYDVVPEESTTVVSEIHAEKRMIVGVDVSEEEKQRKIYFSSAKNPDFPSYSVNFRRSQLPIEEEYLHRNEEVEHVENFAKPSEYGYNKLKKRGSKEAFAVVVGTGVEVVQQPYQQHSPDKPCNIEYCTHVEVPDQTEYVPDRVPVVARRTRTASADELEQENRLTIVVNENEFDNVVNLARDDELGPMTSQSRRCLEEKLYYHPYLPTLSLNRRPIVGFYDKLP